MNTEILILIAIIMGVLARIFLKENIEFKMPEIITYEDGTRALKLNILFTILVGLISGFALFSYNPESFMTPIGAFLATYGVNGLVESVGTKFTSDEEEGENYD